MSVTNAMTTRELTPATPQSPKHEIGPSQRRRLRSGLVSAAALSLMVGGLVLAIPGLGAVGHRVAHARWAWVVLAGGLELASCLGYVLAFQGIFNDIPARFATLVATAEQAFGAVVPVGGAGGIAAGGWLLSRAGMPVRAVAERSAVLFLLTSATNVVTLVLAGAGLGQCDPHPRWRWRAGRRTRRRTAPVPRPCRRRAWWGAPLPRAGPMDSSPLRYGRLHWRPAPNQLRPPAGRQ
jgi:hypothetical protein